MFANVRQQQSCAAVPEAVQRQASSVFLAKAFNWMAIGLGITGIVAWLTVASGLVYRMNSTLVMLLVLAELGLVMFLSFRVNKMSAAAATGSFIGYSALNGLTFAVILLAYTQATIATTFFITAGMFGAMAIFGLVTRRDLSGMGSFMFMGLIGIIIASVVNFFLHSPALYWAISYIGVIVFLGLTAYDVQKIKQIGEQGIMESGEAAIRKGAIMGALTLYLDFINLFLMLLRIFGGGRD